MKILYGYRQSMKRPKFLITLIFLILASFLAGAYLEKTEGLLQGMTAAAPKVEDSLKSFIRERFIFKLNTRGGNSGPVPAAAGTPAAYRMIRGP